MIFIYSLQPESQTQFSVVSTKIKVHTLLYWFTVNTVNLKCALLSYLHVLFSFIYTSDLSHLSKKYCEFDFTAVI